MYTRRLPIPTHTFFLFGPRGTGKSTWLRQRLPDAHWFDLLRVSEVLELTRRPELFRARVEALPEGSWIVVDEVQRLPALLDEVHALIAETGNRYHFALSGSSARKLRRLDTNLLAGRAITRQFSRSPAPSWTSRLVSTIYSRPAACQRSAASRRSPWTCLMHMSARTCAKRFSRKH